MREYTHMCRVFQVGILQGGPARTNTSADQKAPCSGVKRLQDSPVGALSQAAAKQRHRQLREKRRPQHLVVAQVAVGALGQHEEHGQAKHSSDGQRKAHSVLGRERVLSRARCQ